MGRKFAQRIEGRGFAWRRSASTGTEHAFAIGDRVSPSCPATRPRIDWVIVGSESGPGARPMDTEWARSIKDQCVAACVLIADPRCTCDPPKHTRQLGIHRTSCPVRREPA